ncbi:response regulator transcription factor [Imbroritus primus]|uniref:Response regulator transcription factor n=1 Tax=Imbroritus primus TaxID=3058603 RepID=A0ACD3SPX3_9BURK|nr:response regulator transcription factor [Burkholderiaceae bacterium PBA]
MRILIVEDDPELADGLASSLAQSGYAVDAVHSGSSALSACATTPYQLVLLDLGLPDGEGMDYLRQLRRAGLRAPVLILTARDDLQDRVRGLDAGADDYLTKPFELDELEAHVRALLRRSSSVDVTLNFGAITFDTVFRQVTVHGRELELTARELSVLELLLHRPGKVVSKHQIIESLYNSEQEASPSVVEVFISRLRRKLNDAGATVGIRVLRGLGYRLELSAHA